MRFNFTIYPEAAAKLKDAGLVARLKEAKKQEDFPSFYGTIYEDDIQGFIDDMKEKGFFKKAPKEELKTLNQKLNHFLKESHKLKWTIKKPEGNVTDGADIEDFPLLNGYYASFVLTPEEFWNPQELGFDSCFDLWGSLGALIKVNPGSSFRDGYTWTSELPDKSRFISEVTGSEHGDFRLFRTDVTSYETLDPLGNKVSYRPEFTADRAMVIGYHSVEPMFLASILKYVTQENIPSEILKDQGKRFLKEEVGHLDQRFGPFADAGDSRMHVQEYFWWSGLPIPRLNESKTSDAVFLDAQSRYGIYIGADKSLVFVYESDGKREPKVTLSLPPGEIDHLIRGLFVQASKGLGRTSVKQLTDILKYRFSDQFEKDRKDFIKPLSKKEKA
jgi:hypothetical protein